MQALGVIGLPQAARREANLVLGALHQGDPHRPAPLRAKVFGAYLPTCMALKIPMCMSVWVPMNDFMHDGPQVEVPPAWQAWQDKWLQSHDNAGLFVGHLNRGEDKDTVASRLVGYYRVPGVSLPVQVVTTTLPLDASQLAGLQPLGLCQMAYDGRMLHRSVACKTDMDHNLLTWLPQVEVQVEEELEAHRQQWMRLGRRLRLPCVTHLPKAHHRRCLRRVG